ncbi:MAG: hypothetical protein V8S89_07395 [Oscillospiraceae bacterium]
MIRQLLLDIDDTLLDFSQAEGWALRQAFAACGLALPDDVFAQYRQINRRQWQRLDAGEIPRDDVLYGRFRLLFAALGWRADPVAVETRYRSFLAQAHFPSPAHWKHWRRSTKHTPSISPPMVWPRPNTTGWMPPG